MTEDVNTKRQFESASPQWQKNAQAWFLDEPGTVRIEIENDVACGTPVGVEEVFGNRVEVQFRDPVPVAVGVVQHRVIECTNVETLPEPFLVFRTRPRTDVLAAEVGTHQVQEPGDGGRA